jgi:hypothetical protein
MFEHPVTSEVEHLANADPACCDRDELTALVAASGRVRSWLDAYDARLARRATELAASDVLSNGGRRTEREVVATKRRAALCEQFPAVADALTAGRVAAGHLDVLSRSTSRLDAAGRAALLDRGAELIAAAETMGVEEFRDEVERVERVLSEDDGLEQEARNRRDRRLRRWRDGLTGVCHTHLELDTETDAAISAALAAAVRTARARPQSDGLTFDQLQTDAFVALILRPASFGGDEATAGPPRVPEVSVLIDVHTLLDGLHDRSVSETTDGHHLPASAVRRLCCEATVIPIVLDGDGVTLDVGRQRRTATPEQRQALRAMYRTCAHPHCLVHFDVCQIHHVTPWERGGATDLANLVPLCSVHHHLVHEGGWTLTLSPDRVVTLVRPDGSTSHRGATIDRAPHGVGSGVGTGVGTTVGTTTASDDARIRAQRIAVAEQLGEQLAARLDGTSTAPAEPRARAPAA